MLFRNDCTNEMLSRHLYRIDEVISCLKYCLVRRIHTESAFWCLECIDTWLVMPMFESILYSWFYGVGTLNLQILSDLLDILEKDEIDMEEALRFTHAICNIQKRDVAVFYLMSAGLTEKQPDTLSIHGNTTENPAFQAIHQKKAVLAWTLLRTEWTAKEDEIWEFLLKKVDDKTSALFKRLKENEFIREHFLWESRALALLCSSEKYEWSSPSYEAPAHIQKDIDTWKAVEGKRERRIYKVRIEALQYGVQRSNEPSNQCNLIEIREPFWFLRNSPYWEGVREDIGVKWGTIVKNDDLKESFYDLYFPDDIPDEWSLKDQEKSHTYGLRAKDATDEIQERKHLRNFFSGYPSRGLLSWTSEALSKYPYGKGGFQKLYNENQENWKILQESWDLKPKIKKIQIPQ